MADRRAQLVDAGIELILEQSFQDLLTSVDTRSITEAAGVTTGSFFHHFANRAQFTDAVAERLVELWEQSTQRTLGVIESFIDAPDADVRAAARAEWSSLVHESALSGLQHLLWVARGQRLREGSSLTGADVLAQGHRDFNHAVVPAYGRAIERIGREMLPPFTLEELSIALSALANGLEMRRTVDPGSVRDDLYADLLASLIVTVTRPAGERVEEADVSSLDRELVLRAEGRSRESPGGTWRQIVEAAAPLFAERRLADVKIAEIAEVAGVSTSTVYHQFGSVSAVAAAGWARHVPELESIASEPLTAAEGPIVRMEQVLTRFIQIARQERGALEGLVLEVVARSAGDSRPAAPDPPLASLLVPHVRELRARGLLRRRIDSTALARSIMQLTAMRVLSAPEDPDERIIDETLGMLLEGALGRGPR